MQTFDIVLRFRDHQFFGAASTADWYNLTSFSRKRYHRASRRHSRKIIDFALLEDASEISREELEYQELRYEYEEYCDRIADECEGNKQAAAIGLYDL